MQRSESSANSPHNRTSKRDSVAILGNPLSLLRQEHRRQLTICNELEQVADSLPDNVDIVACRRIAERLVASIRLHHADEEQGLLPLLQEIPELQGQLLRFAERVTQDHISDEDAAAEVADALFSLAETGRAANPEMLGYMFRGFFENLRRQIFWEETVLLPMAETNLDTRMQETLTQVMADNRS